MNKKDEKVSMFGLQNLIVLSDFMDSKTKVKNKSRIKEKRLSETIRKTQKKRDEGTFLTVVSVGF